MKLYELNKGDRFKADYYNTETDELILTATGTFLGTNGVYGKIKYDGVEYFDYYPFSLIYISTEVERIDE